MEPHIGSEQGGTRPVVVLQNDVGNRYAPTLIVATVTSRTEKKRYQPTHVLIAHNTAFEKPSVVQLEQIFTIDKSRIQRFLGQTTRHEMRRIEEALMNSLEINEWDRSVWACLNITSAAFAGKCRAWHFSRALNGISTLERWLTTSTVERQLPDLSRMRA